MSEDFSNKEIIDEDVFISPWQGEAFGRLFMPQILDLMSKCFAPTYTQKV